MNSKQILRIILLVVVSLVMLPLLTAQDLWAAPQDQLPTVTLSNVDPQQVAPGQAVTITLTGSSFSSGATIQLSGQSPVSATFVSDTTLTALLPDTLPAGSYSVTVTNPDGSNATMANALVIQPPPITISRTEPQVITSGQEITLSVLGSNFTTNTVVRVVGVGLLPTTFLHNGALTASVPASILPGQYAVEINDPSDGTVKSPNLLVVIAPTLPTTTPLPPATPLPVTANPSLAINNFRVEPGTIDPGQSVQLSFIVVNRGNQSARAVNVSLGTGSKFVPAGGQASLILPDMNPGASFNSQMTVSAALDIPSGPVTIPLVLSYQDNLGERYTTNAELSVTVRAVATNSQIIIDAYTVDPALVEPGSAVTVRMTVANVGNVVASQVLVRFTGADGVLISNGRGDSIPVGDLQPGQRLPVQIPMTVSTTAKTGPQSQPIAISYWQEGEQRDTSSSITVDIANVNKPQPLLLLSEYATGEDVLQPGSRFTLDITLQNAGNADAKATMVTFGIVQSSNDGDPGTGSGGSSGGGGSQSSTTPSTTFAPLGTAGLVFVGDILSGAQVSATQEFIVSGSVSSGIYTLPVTLQYVLPDGSGKQTALNISLVVLVPPRLQINLQSPLPEMANTGEPLPLLLALVNGGRTSLNLTSATVTTKNADVLEGAEISLETLKADDDTTLNALIMPLEEGPVEVTLTLNYLNDLGQPSSIVQTYLTNAVQPPPPIDMPIDMPPPPVEPEPQVNWFGQIMMALLGLGS